MKTLIAIALLVVSLAATAQSTDEQVYALYCDGDALISNLNTKIYRFYYPSDCKRALMDARVTYGNFCDGEKLIRKGGDMAAVFDYGSDCNVALHGLRESKRGLFCYENYLYHIDKGLIIDLKYKSDCVTALQQMGRYQGFFCRDNVMMNEKAQIVRKFQYGSDCKSALYSISG
jgi:hypothetical protein